MSERKSIIHVRGGFSETHGMGSCNTQMQLNDLDDRTRIILFNKITEHLSWYYANKDGAIYNDGAFHKEDALYRSISSACGKIADPNIHYYIKFLNEYLQDVIPTALYNEVFDLVELICKLCICGEELSKKVNDVFKQEYVGYRFVDGRIIPITDENEIKSIEEACGSKFEGPRIHIKKAVGFIADRERKDYKNCIKESISAVESICSIIVEDENATLGKAIKQLKDNGLTIHPALEKAFLNLYGYTSDEGGIRHSESMFESDVTFEEAKFMLVSCSAFVNYLIANYGKVGGVHA